VFQSCEIFTFCNTTASVSCPFTEGQVLDEEEEERHGPKKYRDFISFSSLPSSQGVPSRHMAFSHVCTISKSILRVRKKTQFRMIDGFLNQLFLHRGKNRSKLLKDCSLSKSRLRVFLFLSLWESERAKRYPVKCYESIIIQDCINLVLKQNSFQKKLQSQDRWDSLRKVSRGSDQIRQIVWKWILNRDFFSFPDCPSRHS
jgi:hypothetical protein